MASLRLILIPFAGAGASAFRGWGELLAPAIEAFALELPGRESLAKEDFHRRWPEMIADARAAIATLPEGPLAFFGHSLGALISLDLARGARHRTSHLFCAARPWPGAGAPEEADPSRLHELYGEAPPSFSNAEIRDYALPILSADLELLGSYVYGGPAGLSCPLTVLAGESDPITKNADLPLWAKETSGKTEIVRLTAGHYFLEKERARLAAEISARLAP
jgi:surfactin synthase thioesterase subunit